MGRARDEQELTVDPATLRTVMAHFPTGITAITATCQGQAVGMAANSFTSVSLDPPLLLFCPALSSSTWPKIRAADAFAVNILPAGAEATARQFAERGVDRFDGVAHRPGPLTGAPILEDASAYLECRIRDIHDGGDHAIVVGLILSAVEQAAAPPLVFYGSAYRQLTLPDA